jgi:hypothetical protein
MDGPVRTTHPTATSYRANTVAFTHGSLLLLLLLLL